MKHLIVVLLYSFMISLLSFQHVFSVDLEQYATMESNYRTDEILNMNVYYGSFLSRVYYTYDKNYQARSLSDGYMEFTNYISDYKGIYIDSTLKFAYIPIYQSYLRYHDLLCGNQDSYHPEGKIMQNVFLDTKEKQIFVGTTNSFSIWDHFGIFIKDINMTNNENDSIYIYNIQNDDNDKIYVEHQYYSENDIDTFITVFNRTSMLPVDTIYDKKILRISDDKKYIATVDMNLESYGDLVINRSDTFDEEFRFNDNYARIDDIEFSKDNRYVVTAGNLFNVWDLEKNRLYGSLFDDRDSSIKYLNNMVEMDHYENKLYMVAYGHRFYNLNLSYLTSVARKNNSKLNIYPNPNKGSFTLDIPTNDLNHISALKIYDIYGSEVFSQNVSNKNTKFNVTHLPTGNYILSLQFKDEESHYESILFTIGK